MDTRTGTATLRDVGAPGLKKVLCGASSNAWYMACGELPEKRFHISTNGALRVWGYHPAAMVRSVMDGKLWGVTCRIRGNRMQGVCLHRLRT